MKDFRWQMSAKWLFTFKNIEFPLLPLLTHSVMYMYQGQVHFGRILKCPSCSSNFEVGVSRYFAFCPDASKVLPLLPVLLVTWQCLLSSRHESAVSLLQRLITANAPPYFVPQGRSCCILKTKQGTTDQDIIHIYNTQIMQFQMISLVFLFVFS